MNSNHLAPPQAPGASPDASGPGSTLVEAKPHPDPEPGGADQALAASGAEPSPAPPGADPDPAATGAGSVGRIVGLDLARALAVFGMYYSHVGPYAGGNGFTTWLMDLPHGRSSALFATLAGLSLVLLAGGNRSKTGRAGRQAVVKIVIRAVILLALGTALTAANTSIIVILAFYGVYFLLALPFMRLRARTLAILAGAVAVGGPVLISWIQTTFGWNDAFSAHDPLEAWGSDGLASLLLFGTYPALTWMAYIFAGMAIGKLDLAAKADRIRLAIVGPALALLGYGGSWLVMRVPGINDLLGYGKLDEWKSMTDEEWKALEKEALEADSLDGWADESWAKDDSTDFGRLDVGKDVGQPYSWTDLAYLTEAKPHSGTPFEVIGNIGVAIFVIVGAVALLSRFALARKLLTPITAVGVMSLTVYVGHVAAVWFLYDRPESTYEGGWALWGWFVGGAVVFAFVWSRFFRRGPLEYGLAAATRLARLVK